MVSMIRRPAARRARPVSVISTTASAISGILASVAPWDSRTSASTPCSARKRRVRPGYSVDTRTPAGRSPTVRTGESSATASTTRIGPGGGLAVAQLAERRHLAGGLLDPVPPGDAQVEQALGHVLGDLLGPQDAHLGDPGVVDGGPVVDVGAAQHGQVGGLEQVEGGPLERAFGQDEAQHGGRTLARSELRRGTRAPLAAEATWAAGQQVGHLDGGRRPPRSPCCRPWSRPARRPARWCRW